MHIRTFAICAFWLIAQPALAATPSDLTDCGSQDPNRQIAGCSHVIEERLFPAETCESASNCDPGSNCGKSLTGKLFAGNWWGHDWTPIKSCKKIDSCTVPNI